MRRLLKEYSVFAVILALPGCIPYAVGTTAQPVETGALIPSLSVYFVPNGIAPLADSSRTLSAGYTAADLEVRYGVDQRSDIGVRVPGGSGVVLNYKRLLSHAPDEHAPAISVLGGLGFVNAGNHAYGEVALLASARQRQITP